MTYTVEEVDMYCKECDSKTEHEVITEDNRETFECFECGEYDFKPIGR